MDIPRLILITDSARLEGERFFTVVESALKGGVDTMLVREKHLSSAKLLALSAQLRVLTRDHGARLIIHTQADVARAVGADGVHVAATAIPDIPAMRQWLADVPMCFSASCHHRHELNAAAESGADFALLSPVFPTRSHVGAPHLGAERFMAMAKDSPIPVVALGGISVENRHRLAGYGIAVISSLLDAKDPEAAARRLAQTGDAAQA